MKNSIVFNKPIVQDTLGFDEFENHSAQRFL